MVFMILGPLPGMIVKSTPIAGRGVKISAQREQNCFLEDKMQCQEDETSYCSDNRYMTGLLDEVRRQLFHGFNTIKAEGSFLTFCNLLT